MNETRVMVRHSGHLKEGGTYLGQPSPAQLNSLTQSLEPENQ